MGGRSVSTSAPLFAGSSRRIRQSSAPPRLTPPKRQPRVAVSHSPVEPHDSYFPLRLTLPSSHFHLSQHHQTRLCSTRTTARKAPTTSETNLDPPRPVAHVAPG